MGLRVYIYVAIVAIVVHAFRVLPSQRTILSAKWMFGGKAGGVPDNSGKGSNGEYYFVPANKKQRLKLPPQALGQEKTIALFPRNQVLGPLSEEYLGIYELKYRHLLQDVGTEGVFGNIFYSPEYQKLGLVGTLTRAKSIERLEDGGIYMSMQGVGRFYIKSVVTEKPYLKARVQIFEDYYDGTAEMDELEKAVLDETRYSVKLMKFLYPQNNYTVSESVLKNLARKPKAGFKSVSLESEQAELLRRSRFSFGAMEMLKTDAAIRLAFIQEAAIEKRFKKMIKIYQDSTSYLEGELKRKGVVTEEGLKSLRAQLLADTRDMEPSLPASTWYPSNYKNGDWSLGPVLMD